MKNSDYSKIVNEVTERITRQADAVMNVKQLSDYLGLSGAAIRKRCQREQLPFHTKSRRLYFSKAGVDNALLERE